jgi:hypothetical protein
MKKGNAKSPGTLTRIGAWVRRRLVGGRIALTSLE